MDRGVPHPLIWAVLEAAIFTYVDPGGHRHFFQHDRATSWARPRSAFRSFIFMLFIVLGATPSLSTWTEAVQKQERGRHRQDVRDRRVTLFVEVVFLYREFVDSWCRGLLSTPRATLSWGSWASF